MEYDGELKSDGLQGAGEPGYADCGRSCEDGFALKHYHLLGLAFGVDRGVWEAFNVCLKSVSGAVVEGGGKGVHDGGRFVSKIEDDADLDLDLGS